METAGTKEQGIIYDCLQCHCWKFIITSLAHVGIAAAWSEKGRRGDERSLLTLSQFSPGTRTQVPVKGREKASKNALRCLKEEGKIDLASVKGRETGGALM